MKTDRERLEEHEYESKNGLGMRKMMPHHIEALLPVLKGVRDNQRDLCADESIALIRRARESAEAYQKAWKDEITKRQGVEKREQSLRETLESLLHTKKHVTKDHLRKALGLPPQTQD